MSTIICLIWNSNDTYDRHWVTSNGEERDVFIARMKKCYSDEKWNLYFYEAKPVD